MSQVIPFIHEIKKHLQREIASTQVEFSDFGEIIDLCPKSPMGQHQYTIEDRHERCVFCGERSGLDQ